LQHFKAQEESHRVVKNMAKSIKIIMGQLAKLKDIQNSDQLHIAINKFHKMIEEVVEFIEEWLKSWQGAYSVVWNGLTTHSLITAQHVLVVTNKEKAIELQDKLDAFARNFDRDLLIEIRTEQGLIFVSGIQCPTYLDSDFSHHC